MIILQISFLLLLKFKKREHKLHRVKALFSNNREDDKTLKTSMSKWRSTTLCLWLNLNFKRIQTDNGPRDHIILSVHNMYLRNI